MPKGLHAHIYKSALGDCSNGGISGKCDLVTIVGHDVAEIFEATDDAPAVTLEPPHIPGYPPRAVPAEIKKGIGPMFGGCFVYSSDSRFPSDAPIALHDRWESQSLNDTLST